MSKVIAEKLLDIGAVFLRPNEPFTWSSGLKSPIYCDNRLTMSYPEVRNEIANGLASLIKEYFPGADVIAGTATAGIPHAAWVSTILNAPMCYVRSKAKSHGQGNQIEGKLVPGQKVVVIEDLISTGGSVLTAVEAIREAGCEVLGVASIFTYELEKGKERIKAADVEAHSLTNYSVLIDVAFEKGLVNSADVETLRAWRQDPEAWGK